MDDQEPTTSNEDDREKICGPISYLEILRRLHDQLHPSLYLEIGIRHGHSLSLAHGAAIGIDPAPDIRHDLPKTTKIFAQTSDEFFSDPSNLPGADLCFIDGMHLFEYALRDFMNVERQATKGTVVVIDDILPNHPAQALRKRETGAWTGDVWRVVTTIRQHRPDLFAIVLDVAPTGLLLVAGLDPDNRVLSDRYDDIVAGAENDQVVPRSVLQRTDALDPSSEYVDAIFRTLADAKASDLSKEAIRTALAAVLPASGPSFGTLRAGSYEDVVMAPAVVTPSNFGFKLGAYGAREAIDAFRLRRWWGHSSEMEYVAPQARLDEDVIYGGMIFHHFGHFILETLSRIWYIRQNPARTLIWQSLAPDLYDWQLEIFGFFGISQDRIRIIDRPTEFARVTLPDAGFAIGMSFDPVQRDALELFPFLPPVKGHRVWLSRSNFSDAEKILKEAEIQQVLQSRGWTILSPEDLSVRQQIESLREAEVIAGFDGSAFHSLLFARDCNASVRIIGRGRPLPPSFELIATTKGLRQIVLMPDFDGDVLRSVEQVVEFADA